MAKMGIRRSLDGFYAFLDRPLYLPARALLILLVIPLVLSLTEPLWNMTFTAPQYPDGLTLDIYAYTIEGGRDGADLKEINILNHYIGMQPLDRAKLSDLDWIPFGIGLLVLLTLRQAVIGNVRGLVDLVVLTTYFGLFSFGRFYYQLYTYGHNLDPTAPIKVEPFTPVLFGQKTIANFTTESYPQMGTWYVTLFATGITIVLLWHLIAGRREAVRAARRAEAA